MSHLLKILIAICFLALAPAQAIDSSHWDSYRFLIGEWIGEGGSQPGQGTGNFSFKPELQGKVLVRRNRADYPATKDRLAFSHEDLMVIYQEENGSRDRAIYFDNEGHVILYTVEFSADGKSTVFVSGAEADQPRFRLTYSKVSNDALKCKFEIAPPSHPESFANYLEWTAHRKPG